MPVEALAGFVKEFPSQLNEWMDDNWGIDWI